jgi:hypothetical protein
VLSSSGVKPLALLRALMLAACQVAPAATIAGTPYRLIDLSDDFAAFYDRTESLDTQARVAAFKADIIPLFPEFYGRKRFPHLTDEQFDRRIAEALEDFPGYRTRYRSKAAQFESLLGPAFDSFRKAFPGVQPLGDIYLLNSLGELDGGTRTYDGRVHLIFGADVLAQSHPYLDEEPFFHHELFHTYHDDRFTDCGAVWCALWSEGLAVQASKSLNADATDAQLLLTVPEPIPGPVDSHLREAVCEVRARMESREKADLRALFSFDRLNERLPPRFGYYVGYLAAREAGRTHSIQELARLDNEQARPVLDAALASLADCRAPR